MPSHSSRNAEPRRQDALRQSLAQEAARIMIEQGIDDFLFAKRKAAERLRVGDHVALPSNAEIAAALAEHQRLFGGATHGRQLHAQRQHAMQLMRSLQSFEPRLVGSVLDGTATAYSELQLQVFSDQPELVALRLEELGIHARHAQKKLRYEAERQQHYPSFKFVAGDQQIEVVVLTLNDLRQAPLSPIDSRPMARASLREVQSLVATNE